MQFEAFIGLGSNLGDRAANIAQAVAAISEETSGVAVSSLYETAPVGFVAQPKFLNAACRIWTRLSPFELLTVLNQIQRDISCHHAFINGPRAIDLDILVFGRLAMRTPSLTIPHPRMADRKFVLTPLAEIAPEMIHPTLKLTVRELLTNLHKKTP